MERSALKPRLFPWYDYSRYAFSLGLSVGERICFPASTGCLCEAMLRPEFQIEVDSRAVIPRREA
jgi:hypothetical protein